MSEIPRRVKIMATIGPASEEMETLGELLRAGVDIVRLNLSHGDRRGHRDSVARVRALERSLGRHIPVVADLVGPRMRIGHLAQPRMLVGGERVSLGEGIEADLPLARRGLLGHLKVGERLFIDNGTIELTIEEHDGDRVGARVLRGGMVSSGKGINLPEGGLPFEISERDQEDIAFAAAAGVDFIGASYVGSAADVEKLRAFIATVGADMPIIAKIERAAAATHVEAIVAAADAVMVARGDLGVELPLEQVPPLQKRIVSAARARGRPAVIATDMLGSMVTEPRPTRAEVSDVANAVLDGADVLMLSGETAIGRHPVESVRMMHKVIREVEMTRRDLLMREFPRDAENGRDAIPAALSAAVARAAALLPVAAIAMYTQSGSTAKVVARERPTTRILAFTDDARVARRASLAWGVQALIIERPLDAEALLKAIDRETLLLGWVREGDVILVLMGAPFAERPPANTLRIHRVRATEPIGGEQ